MPIFSSKKHMNGRFHAESIAMREWGKEQHYERQSKEKIKFRSEEKRNIALGLPPFRFIIF